jgi:hypothetical protein
MADYQVGHCTSLLNGGQRWKFPTTKLQMLSERNSQFVKLAI